MQEPMRDSLKVGASFLLAAIGRACRPTSPYFSPPPNRNGLSSVLSYLYHEENKHTGEQTAYDRVYMYIISVEIPRI